MEDTKYDSLRRLTFLKVIERAQLDAGWHEPPMSHPNLPPRFIYPRGYCDAGVWLTNYSRDLQKIGDLAEVSIAKVIQTNRRRFGHMRWDTATKAYACIKKASHFLEEEDG